MSWAACVTNVLSVPASDFTTSARSAAGCRLSRIQCGVTSLVRLPLVRRLGCAIKAAETTLVGESPNRTQLSFQTLIAQRAGAGERSGLRGFAANEIRNGKAGRRQDHKPEVANAPFSKGCWRLFKIQRLQGVGHGEGRSRSLCGFLCSSATSLESPFSSVLVIGVGRSCANSRERLGGGN